MLVNNQQKTLKVKNKDSFYCPYIHFKSKNGRIKINKKIKDSSLDCPINEESCIYSIHFGKGYICNIKLDKLSYLTSTKIKNMEK